MAKTKRFKQTDIGPIPEDWEVKRLGDVASTSSGGTPNRSRDDFFGGDIKWFTTSELKDCELYESIEHITKDGLDKSAAKLFPSGTLLMAMYGATIGRLGLLRVEAATNQACCAIACAKVDTKYLYHRLLYKRSEIVDMGCGAGQPNISQAIVRKLLLPLPPLPEQRRIAAALGDVDSLLATYDALIEKKRKIKVGAVQELLGIRNEELGMRNEPRRRLPGFTGAWVEKRLGDVLSIGNGKDYKCLRQGDIPVYGTGGLMTYVDSYLHDGPTVCIGRKGTIDQPQYHEGKIWTVDTLYYTYDFHDADPKYLFYVFTRIDWRSYNAATGVPSLTANSILKIEVVIPPTVAEQRAIAGVLSDMDAEIAELEREREKTRKIREGMMQELLTGRVRLEVE